MRRHNPEAGVKAPDSARIQARNDDGTVLCYDGRNRTLSEVRRLYAAWAKAVN